MDHGERTQGVILQIKTGAKGSKRAVLKFKTIEEELIETPDFFPLFFEKRKKGEQVTVLYDPRNPKTATIDTGFWLWKIPAFLYFGFVFLFLLTIIIDRNRPKISRNDSNRY